MTEEAVVQVCFRCKHWKHKADDTGECRRYAPMPYAFGFAPVVGSPARATWPMTHRQDYCGEFEATGRSRRSSV